MVKKNVDPSPGFNSNTDLTAVGFHDALDDGQARACFWIGFTRV
jgi:hypothetical protein